MGLWGETVISSLLHFSRGDEGRCLSEIDVGGCQKCGPFLGTLNTRCRIIIGTQKGTIILTTTHVGAS